MAEFDLLHGLVGGQAVDHEPACDVVGVVIFGNRMAAAGVQAIHHRVLARKGPQPPTVIALAFVLDKHAPACHVGLMVERLAVAFLQGVVHRREQRLQTLQAVRHGARRQIQPMQPQLFQQTFDGLLAVELVDQNLHPQRRAVQTFGNDLRRQRSRKDVRLAPTLTSRLIATALEDAAVEDSFDLDLRGIFRITPHFQRLTAIGTAALLRR